MYFKAVLLAAVVAVSASAAEMTYKGYITDATCGKAGMGKMDQANLTTSPQDHTLACQVACAKGGFGLMVKEGMDYKFVPFNAKGSREAEALVKKEEKMMKDGKAVYVEVVGEEKMNVLDVKSIKIAKPMM